MLPTVKGGDVCCASAERQDLGEVKRALAN
jgi:hypothetical protein